MFEPNSKGYDGAYIRKDGLCVLISEGETVSGKKGWYWHEAVLLRYTDDNCNWDPVYQTGKSGIGPFMTAKEACHDALGIAPKSETETRDTGGPND